MSNIERFMYLFMGVLWGHFSSSNSPGILAQGLDIHICVDEISFTPPPTTCLLGNSLLVLVLVRITALHRPNIQWSFLTFTWYLIPTSSSLPLAFVASFVAFDIQRCRCHSSYLSKADGWCLTIRVSCSVIHQTWISQSCCFESIQRNPAS